MASKRIRRNLTLNLRSQNQSAFSGPRKACAFSYVSFVLFVLLNARDVSAQLAPTNHTTDPKIAPSTTRFSTSGKQFKLIEQKNRDGKMIRQTLVGEDFVQTSADREADGHLDFWELNRANTMMHMGSPLNGHFSRLEFEKKYPQGILHMEFYRNSKGAFQLISSNARPYTKFRKADNSYEDIVAGCRITEMHLQGTAVETLAALVNPDQEGALRTTLATEAMTPECSKGEFSQNQSKIIDGIMRVVKSDKKETIGKEPSKKPTSKGTYLQCLRYYELDTHASRITSAFSSYLSAMKHDAFKWRITCDANSKDAGDFLQIPNAPPLITLGPAAHQSKVSGDLADAYAATFFHEMLHYSLIADEGITRSIEQCCSQEDGENSSACRRVEAVVRIQKRAQVFENVIAKQFGGKYADYRNSLRAEFGARVDKELGRFLNAAATEYEKVKSECHVLDGTELVGSCRDKFNERLKATIDKEFGDGDNACERATLDKNNAKAYCATLKEVVYEKFQIPSDGLEDKNYCLSGRKNAWRQWLMGNLLSAAVADGVPGSSDQTQILCSMKDSNSGSAPLHLDESSSDLPTLETYASSSGNTPPAFNVPPLAPNANNGVRLILPSTQKQETAAQTGADAVANDSGPSQNFGKPTAQPNQGPDAISYSDQPTQREAQILASLQHQQDTDSHLTQIADRIAQQTFPSAEAKVVADVGSNSSHEAESPSTPTVNLLSYGRSSISATSGNAFPTTPTNLASYPVVQDPLAPSRSIASLPPSGAGDATGSVVGASSLGASSGLSSNHANPGAEPPLLQYVPVYQYRYSGGRKIYQVGGLADPQSGAGTTVGGKNGDRTSQKIQTRSEIEARERKNILAFLQGPYKSVRPELDNTKFVSELIRYAIQVIDDAGKAYGSGQPSSKLVYDERISRLILTSTRTLEANK